MPFARLTLIPAQSPDLTQRLAADLTNLIVSDLGKQRKLTSVLIETPGMAQWSIAATNQQIATHLEVSVTVGTNTEDEKRAFITNAMHLLRRALPELAEATYIVVRDLPGGDWGYDGQTQADRAQSRH